MCLSLETGEKSKETEVNEPNCDRLDWDWDWFSFWSEWFRRRNEFSGPSQNNRIVAKQFIITLVTQNIFNWVLKVTRNCIGFALLWFVIGSENSRHSLNQSDTKRFGRRVFPRFWRFACILLWVLIGTPGYFSFFRLSAVITLLWFNNAQSKSSPKERL